MANPVANLSASAQPEQMKVQTAVNECIRRMKNCSRDLPSAIIEDTLMTNMDELNEGGYGLHWREEVLKSAPVGFERMLKSEKDGVGRVNRKGEKVRDQSQRPGPMDKFLGAGKLFSQH